MAAVDSRALLRGLVDAIRRSVPDQQLRAFQTRDGFGLVKVFYGNPKLHYEANNQPKSSTIEIGLHFEADEFTNARLLGAFRIHERRIHRELPGARLEEWDKGWTRIWEPVAYQVLDAVFQRDVAQRLARYITVLEPMLRDELPADVPWEITRPPASPRATRSRSARTTRSGSARSASPARAASRASRTKRR